VLEHPRPSLDERHRLTVLDEHAPPILEPPPTVIAFADRTTEEPIRANESRWNPVTFIETAGRPYVTVITTDPGHGLRRGSSDVARERLT